MKIKTTLMKGEDLSERLLWGSRYIVIVAVVASILVCVGMYLVATLDVIHLIKNIFFYLDGRYSDIVKTEIANSTEAIGAARSTIVASIVEIIDGYLLATTMLIFSFGLYELFISRIDAAQSHNLSSRVLSIQSIDDLKERLSKLIFLILVVKFFENALKPSEIKSFELLYFACGIFLIGAAIALSHRKGIVHKKEPENKEDKKNE